MASKYSRVKPKRNEGYIVNEDIRARELRVIAENGDNLGVIPRTQAFNRAQENNLDLVLISKEDADPVVAKIMDFGKFLYERKKKLSEAKKHQKVIQIKEVKMRPNIGDQDYWTKMKRAIQFLNEGKKVKFTLQFRGRQMIMMTELGNNMFDRIMKDLTEANIGTLIAEKDSKGKPFWSRVISIKPK